MTPLQLLLLALPATLASNTVAISHQSYSNSYYSGQVNVVKTAPEEEPEYVTSFYKRVKDKRKKMFGKQLMQHDTIEKRKNLDHSLDHYFDHQLSSKLSSKPKPVAVAAHHHHHHDHAEAAREKPKNEKAKKEKVVAPVKKLCPARSVRGGASGLMSKPSSAAGASGRQHLHHHVADDFSDNGHPSSQTHLKRQAKQGHNHGHHPRSDHHLNRHHGNSQQHAARASRVEEEYDDFEEEVDEETGNEYPEHHLGLLRVPCSIAINSGEASLGHHSSHHCSHDQSGCSQTKTAMAAYVDTGAQVTVISAAAAKRAGIYHLIDRRYAGRATGVGHCKVLGRIPARHVYFMLGEGCDNDNNNDEYYEEDYGDYRGGNQDDYCQDEEEDNSNNVVQMDGPALTVLEGTVTQGVDVLFGLDVLQDWEAEIRMGPKKSITLKTKRSRSRGSARGGSGSSVVIPFASPAKSYSRTKNQGRRNVLPLSNKAGGSHASHARSRTDPVRSVPSIAQSHQRSKPNSSFSQFENDIFDNLIDNDDEDYFEDDYSPNGSDIESDLDLLEQSERRQHHNAFSEEESVHAIMDNLENELMGVDFIDDVDDDMDLDDLMVDGEEDEIDMSGL